MLFKKSIENRFEPNSGFPKLAVETSFRSIALSNGAKLLIALRAITLQLEAAKQLIPALQVI